MRYVVIGTAGAGKTTFARALAARLAVPYIELDALYWGPDWTPRTTSEFTAAVRAAAAADRWVADGNYTVVRDVLWPRATHILWLDFSRRTVWSRVIRRTFRRSFTREPLWADNRESLQSALLTRQSILLWSFTTFGKNRRKFTRLRAQPEHAHLTWQVARTPREAQRLLETFPAA